MDDSEDQIGYLEDYEKPKVKDNKKNKMEVS